jgi:hypothetical protein
MSSILADRQYRPRIEPKCGRLGVVAVAGSQPMSTAVHMEPKLWRSNSIFNYGSESLRQIVWYVYLNI